MTQTPTASVMLASDYPRKGHASVISVRPTLALGTTAGEGDSQNPKLSPNEDSAAVVALADGGFAMAVADAHFGPTAGESAVRAFVKALTNAKVPSPAALARVVVDLDGAVREARSASDRSETTFLAATITGSTLTWASVGDSLLFVKTPEGVIDRVVEGQGIFLGGRFDLGAMRDAGNAWLEGVLHAGTIELPVGSVVMLASDGIEEDCSGLTDAMISNILSESRPLLPRVETLLARGGRLPTGGRDNLTLVVCEVA